MARTASQQALARQMVLLGALGFLLVGGVGGWAATTSLSNAVIGEASVIIDDNAKKIQHRDGGIVSELLVREGDHVEAGAVLLRIDGTTVRANLAIVESSLAQFYVRRNRLTSERSGQPNFDIDILVAKGLDTPENQKFVAGERSLFKSRMMTLDGKRKQLRERKGQLAEEIRGDDLQLEAIEEGMVLVNEELQATSSLYDKKLVTMQRLNALKRQKVDLEGQRGQRKSSRAQSEGKINEIDLQILQLDEDRRAEISSDLADVEAKIAEMEQRRIAIRDQMARLDVMAPVAGRIFQLGVHTVGGVVAPGDPLMLLAPDKQSLTVEAKIASRNIDQVQRGQKVDIRFSAFDQRTTPEVVGTIVSISPDIIREERTGISYYPVRILPDRDTLSQMTGLSLYPGMPAEVFIRISDRTVLSYLTKPLTDQISHTFREE